MDHSIFPVGQGIEPKIETSIPIESGNKLCFICSTHTHTSNSNGIPINYNIPPAVKILTSYILHNPLSSASDDYEREELERRLLSFLSHGHLSLCSQCLSKAEKLSRLHEELKKTRMQILDVLRELRNHLKSKRSNFEEGGSHFQDILREFLCNDATEVRVELLRSAGFRISSLDLLSLPKSTSKVPQANPGNGVSIPENSDSNGSCFLCLSGRPSNPHEDQECSISTPVKILISYILQNTLSLNDGERHELQLHVSISSICTQCLSRGKNLSGHHSHLDKLQVEILAVLGNLQNYLKTTLSERGTMEIRDDVGLSLSDFQDVLHKEFLICDLNSKKDELIEKNNGKLDESNNSSAIKTENSSGDDNSNSGSEDNHDEEEDTESDDSSSSDGDDGEHISEGMDDYLENLENDKEPPDPSKAGHWNCDICLELISRGEILQHLKTHPEFEEYYQCDICFDSVNKRTFGTYKGLIWHYLRLQHEVQVPCKLCQDLKRFELRDLCRHLYEFHKLNHGRLPCKYEDCSREFYDPLTRMEHHREKHDNPDEFPCDKCPKSFKTEQLLGNHKSCTHPESKGEYPCPSCPKICSREKYLRMHQKAIHEGWKPKPETPTCYFECNVCPMSYQSKSSLLIHVQVDHENRPPNQLQCPSCPKVLENESRFHYHLKLHEGKAYTCTVCNKAFKVKGILTHHMERVHCNGNKSCPNVSKNKGRYQYHLKSHEKDEKIPTCTKCNKVFNTKRGLRRHIKRIHDLKLQCPSCPKVLENITRFRFHLKHDHGEEDKKPLKCPSCPAVFRHKGHLSRHMKTFHDDNIDEDEKEQAGRFPCNFCEMTFQYPYQVTVHVNVVHKKREAWTCLRCDKSFSNRKNMQMHVLRVHFKKNQRFACGSCSKDFSTSKGLNYHKKTVHEGLKLKCSQCDSFFMEESNLQKHIQLKHGETEVKEEKFHCDQCQKTFPRRSNLRVHKKIVHETKETACPFCSKVFKNEILLARHKRSMHEGRRSLKCPHCPKLWLQPSHLKAHIQYVHEVPEGEEVGRFICPQCGIPFKLLSRLDRHIQDIHKDGGNAKIISCPKCPKMFASRLAMKCHHQTNHEENPEKVKCPECSRLFFKHFLWRHVQRVHRKLRKKKSKSSSSLQCQYCPRQFARNVSVKIHEKYCQKTKSKAVPESVQLCQFCSRKCSNRWTLKLHERICKKVLPEKKFPCPFCSIGYNKKSMLTAHKQLRHPSEYAEEIKIAKDQNQDQTQFICEFCSKSFKKKHNLRAHVSRVHDTKTEKTSSCENKTYLCNARM